MNTERTTEETIKNIVNQVGSLPRHDQIDTALAVVSSLKICELSAYKAREQIREGARKRRSQTQ